MTRGTARLVTTMGLLMVLLGVTNLVLNGVGQWSGWVLVSLGLFSTAQGWRSARTPSAGSGAFAISWRLLLVLLLGGTALGVLLGAWSPGRAIELVVLGVYAGAAVVVLLLRPARRSSQPAAGPSHGKADLGLRSRGDGAAARDPQLPAAPRRDPPGEHELTRASLQTRRGPWLLHS